MADIEHVKAQLMGCSERTGNAVGMLHTAKDDMEALIGELQSITQGTNQADCGQAIAALQQAVNATHDAVGFASLVMNDTRDIAARL